MSELAILGGTPLREKGNPVYNTIGEAEKKAVMEVLDSGELSGFTAGNTPEFWGGKKVLELEKAFKDHFGVKHAIAVNSATSGLHCAINALQLEPGDEVITSPLTMSASATCILVCGGVPIFADIEDKTFCLDPKSVEERITDRTRAIVAVNIFGHAAQLDEIMEIARKHNLKVIEDNAQAPDADYRGRKTATIGDAGIFSFNRHKVMQCGEGGILITNDDDMALRCALFRNHGEIAVKGMGIKDIANAFGVNYRMGEMEAAVAKEQFLKLPKLNESRIRLANRITEGLKDIDGITAPHVESDCSHVYYFYPIKFDEKIIGMPRELFCKAVQEEGFYLRSGYVVPLHLEPNFQEKVGWGRKGFPFTENPRNEEISYAKGICPVAERMTDKEIMITNIIYEPFTVEDMDLFVTAMKKVIANKDELLKANL